MILRPAGELLLQPMPKHGRDEDGQQDVAGYRRKNYVGENWAVQIHQDQKHEDKQQVDDNGKR